MKKRILSLFLSLVMVIGMVPTSVFAAEETQVSGLDTSNLTFDVSDPAGYVSVSFVDDGVRPDDADISDAELYGTAAGTIIQETKVPYEEGDSIATVTVRLLEAMGIDYDATGTVDASFYLSALLDFELNGKYYASFGEFDAGSASGWCVRLNNWHINQSSAAIEVEDGDVINWLYTCQYGADIGADFTSRSAEITDVVLSDADLDLVYDVETEQYTCTVSEDISSIAFEAQLANYGSVVTVMVDGEEVKYRPNKAIAVNSGSTIVLSSELKYMDAANNNQVTVYTDTVTIQLQTEEPNNAPVVNENAPASLEAVAGETITVDLSRFFSDADGDTLTYSMKAAALGIDQTLEGSVFSGAIPVTGTYEVVVTASDGKESVSHTVALTVYEEDANTAPNIKEAYAETKSNTWVYSSSYVYIYMDDIFEDADGDALTYSATLNGEEVEVTYNSYSRQYYIMFAVKPATYEYKIVANDGKADSEVFTAVCIGTSASITAPEESSLMHNDNCFYYIKGSAAEDTFALDYTLDIDADIVPEWSSGNTSILDSNGDGTFTVGDVNSRTQVMVGVTYGKDTWGSTLYLGTRYVYIMPSAPEFADITAPLAEHEDKVEATIEFSAVSGGWYSSEFDYEVADASICSVEYTGSYGIKVTPKALGTTIVTATFKYDESVKCDFAVTVTGLSVQIEDQPDSDDVIFEDGGTVQLEVLGASEDETFTWSSADESIATVDENGLVTVKNLGAVYITATSSFSTEDEDVKASVYLQIKENGKVYLDDLALTQYSYFGHISAKAGFHSAQLEYDWDIDENRYSYSTLAFTPYFDDQDLNVTLYYQVSGGAYQTMSLTDGTAVSISNGLAAGENVIRIEVCPKDDEENVTVYTFNMFRPYNPTNTITSMTVYPNGESALSYPVYEGYKEATLFRWDEELGDFQRNTYNNNPYTGWNSSHYTYKLFVYGSRTSEICMYPVFGYTNERVMIYVNGEPVGEAVTSWKSTLIPVEEDEMVITLHVNSEKYHAAQEAAGAEDPFAEPEKIYTIYVEKVDPLGMEAQILSAELSDGEFYEPGFSSSSYAISALIPADKTSTQLTFTVPADVEVYKTSAADENKLTPVKQNENGNNVYTIETQTITGTGTSAYTITNLILQITDEEGNVGTAQYAFTVSQRGTRDVYPDRVTEYLCIGSQYTNLSSYGTMPERTLKNGGGVLSLGNFGGYIVYQYDTPIENDPSNPYGVDFVIYGNSFGNGAHEPGYVQVSADGETWYTLAGSDHYEDYNDWGFAMTYTNQNGKSAWVNSNGESGENYNYPVASAYPYFTWTETLEQSMTVSGPRLNSSYVDAYGSAAAVLPSFGYVDVNTNGTISGISNNPYNHYGTLAAGGDMFDLDWAVDENGMPVELESISYIRVATASSIYAGAIGEKSTEVTAVNRVTNTAETAVGETDAPSAITMNGTQITVPENGSTLTIYLTDIAAADEESEAILHVAVAATEDSNIYIGSVGGVERSYTAIPEKGIIRIIVQEGEKEPYICYITIEAENVDQNAADTVMALIDAIGEITMDSADAIQAARIAYDVLTEEQKALVANYAVLTAAEARLEQLMDEATAVPVEVYVTIADKGTVVMAQQKIIVTDNNNNGFFDVDDTLWAAHEESGIEYSSAESAWGLGITTLWGDTSGNFGYWLNNASCWSLEDAVADGDHLTAFVYQDGVYWSDSYAKFDSFTYTADTEITVALEIAGYDEYWNTVFYPLAGADVTVYDENLIAVNREEYTVVDNGDGTYRITFTEEGNYYLIAEHSDPLLVPAISTMTVTITREDTDTVCEGAKDICISTGNYLETLAAQSGITVGSVGGEWAAIGLARSDRNVPDSYYDAVLSYVEENINDAEQLHRAKSTENSRVILALTALEYDVTNVDGHNLLTGLNSMSYLKKQGINGPIWALIAFDSYGYEIPDGDVTREGLIGYILSVQLYDGGWALSGTASDVDMTAMAVQSLAPYYDTDAEVKAAVDEALAWLSSVQMADGGYFSADGYANCESCAQVIVALTTLGIDPHTDERFVKNDRSVVDAICDYYVTGGGFRHVTDGECNGMATEQGYYALTAYFRFLNDQTALYDMSDVTIREDYGESTDSEEPGESTTPEEGTQSGDPCTPDESPETGEQFPMKPWFCLMMLSLLAMADILFTSGKKHNSDV